jgi:uncharacterized membrane protein YdjX (TVP38/TMEM64 family)
MSIIKRPYFSMKFLKNYAPILLMVLCAAVVGTLLATGVIDLDTVPALVKDRPWIAIAIILALYLVKGICGVILHSALIIVSSLIFDLPTSMVLNGIGTALCLSVSYCIGRLTDPAQLSQKLESHPKLKRYFVSTRQYGFVPCFAIHLLGLNLEVQGVLFGMMRLPFLTYLASSWLAVIPSMTCLCVLGDELSISSPAFWITAAVDVVFLAFGFLYTRKRILSEPQNTSGQ